jgi:hypothetical protein
MLIAGNVETMAREISSAIQEYLEKENKTETNPDEVMDLLIDKGIFEKVKKKKLKTLQLESVLIELTRIERTNLIPGLRSEKTRKKTLWYFDKV